MHSKVKIDTANKENIQITVSMIIDDLGKWRQR